MQIIQIKAIFTIIGFLILFAISLNAQARDTAILEHRQFVTSSGQFSDRSVEAPIAESELLSHVQALDISGATINNLEFSGHAAMIESVPALGNIKSNRNDSFLVLSTGRATHDATAPGTDFVSSGRGSNTAKLSLDIKPDEGASILYITYKFLTAEYPTFSDLGFQDVFTATLTSAQGARTIVEIASDDPRLYSVSDSGAADSGFDLFTETPGELSGDFDFGLPAAGMTGWRTAGIMIPGNGPLTLDLEIRDVGDGLVDSAVLIDELVATIFLSPKLADSGQGCIPAVSYCNTLFLQPSNISSTGTPQIPANVCPFETQVSSALNVSEPFEFRGGIFPGVVADGVTRWPITAIASPQRQFAEFTFIDAIVPEDGGLGEFGSFDRLESIRVDTEQFDSIRWVGQAQFYAPENYLRPSLGLMSEYGPERTVTVQSCLENSGGADRICFQIPVTIRRPSVVLMHGLWSSSEAWFDEEDEEQFPLIGNNSLAFRIADYSSNFGAARSFNENRFQPQAPMFESCQELFDQFIYSTQVDYIGHSMGGNLAREYYRWAPFQTINKLFTMNTPHLGSPLANLVLTYRDDIGSFRGLLVSLFFNAIGRPIGLGAIDDLAVGSDAINRIPQTPIPSNAMVGLGGTQWSGGTLSDAPGLAGDIHKGLVFISGDSDLFENLQHDLVVGRVSQEGGIAPGASSTFQGLSSIHFNVTRSEAYARRLFCPLTGDSLCTAGDGLLNARNDSAVFDEFPASAGLAGLVPQKVSQSFKADSRGELIEGGIEITAPADGTVVEAGDSVPINIQTIAPFNLQRAMLMSPFGVDIISQTPFTANLGVPSDYIGTLEVSVLGADADGNFSQSETLSLTVETQAVLQSIAIDNRDIYLNGFSDRRNVRVTGTYSDGVDRDITDSSLGTSYQSSDPTIASVSSEGQITPRRDGVTTLVVQNQSFQDSIRVEVLNIGDLVFRDGFE